MFRLKDKYRFFLAIVLAAPALILQAQTDSIPPARDSVVFDLTPVRISGQGLEAEIDYGARDSMWLDVPRRQLHLWGAAFVKYTSLEVKADYILMDYEKNELLASQWPDSTGVLAGLPEFTDGEQAFSATKLRYNFKTRKGIIYEARTQQEDLYVLGERAKFIAASGDSTTKTKNVIYNKNALLTTCDDPSPHFGIRTRKLKVVPDKMAVTGFSNLEVAGIPTPLILPFGFYPITKTRKAGLIIPRDFEFADQEGLGLKQWGWYQPINDHMDVTLRFNAYVSGSWGVTADTRYNYRYKNAGNFSIRYNNRVIEDAQARRVSAKSFGVSWTHNQDPKAHPTRKFGGTINIQTNQDQQRNQNNFANVYQNTLTSNLNYSRIFPGKPMTFNAGLSHSQNTQTRLMNITLPNAAFTVQRVFPFKKKIPGPKERWYEKVSLTYNARLQNSLQTPDTTLFTAQTLQNARMGIQHQANTDVNFKIFKYINVAPRLNYEENWYPYIVRRELLDEIRFVYDTTFDAETGEVIEVRIDSAATRWGIDTSFREWGFNTLRKFDAGISMNTNLFFTKQFKKGWFRGIRHTLKPSASIGIGPDYSRYFRMVDTDLRGGVFNTPQTYSIFDDAVFGRPPSGQRDIVLNYALGNVLEMKYFSAKKDTILRKRIFDNLVFSGSYNFSSDSLQWSTIGTNGLFRLFNKLTNLTWNLTLDPYVLTDRGVRVNQLMIREKKRLFRVANFGVQLNTNLTIGQLRDLFTKKELPTGGPPRTTQPVGDSFFGWFENFRVSHRISFNYGTIAGTNRDTVVIGTNNISFSGSIPLSSKWSLDIGNISYDFPAKRVVYPDLGFTRDLHCWELSLRWQPVRGTYEFFIAVKPGTLDFLKVPYRKNIFDAQAQF